MDAPKRIYLHDGDGNVGNAAWCAVWCQDQIADEDVGYDRFDVAAALRARIADLGGELADFQNATKASLDPCADEQHCACVPFLHKRIKELEILIAEAEDFVQRQADEGDRGVPTLELLVRLQAVTTEKEG